MFRLVFIKVSTIQFNELTLCTHIYFQPFAVVLVPSWKKIRHLLCVTHGLLQGEKKIRIIELYGSGEDLKMVS